MLYNLQYIHACTARLEVNGSNEIDSKLTVLAPNNYTKLGTSYNIYIVTFSSVNTYTLYCKT